MSIEEKGVVLTRQTVNGEEVIYPMTTLSMVQGNERLIKKDEPLDDTEKSQIKQTLGIKDGGYYKPEVQPLINPTTGETPSMYFTWSPSDPNAMPAVPSVEIQLPKGPQGPQGPEGPRGLSSYLYLYQQALSGEIKTTYPPYNGSDYTAITLPSGIEYAQSGVLRDIKSATMLDGRFAIVENGNTVFFNSALAIPFNRLPDYSIPEYNISDLSNFWPKSRVEFTVTPTVQQSCLLLVDAYKLGAPGSTVVIRGFYKVDSIELNNDGGHFGISYASEYTEKSPTNGWKEFSFNYVLPADPQWVSFGFWEASGSFSLGDISISAFGSDMLLYSMTADPYFEEKIFQLLPKNPNNSDGYVNVFQSHPDIQNRLLIIDLGSNQIYDYGFDLYNDTAYSYRVIKLFESGLPTGGQPGQVLTMDQYGNPVWSDPQLPTGAAMISVNDPNPSDPDYSESGSITLS